MKQLFNTFILLLLSSALYAGIGTPFILSGIKKVYPVVEIKTGNVDQKLKKQIQKILLDRLSSLGIETKGYDPRAFAILISRAPVGSSQKLVLKTTLIMGEQVKRRDGMEVFAITYEVGDIYEPDMDFFEDSIIESVEYLLDMFESQYQEENKVHSHKEFSVDMAYQTDFRDAVVQAKKQKKDILFVMVTNYCPWCRKLEKQTLQDKEVNDFIHKNYVPLLLNREKREFPKELYKPIVPVVYILDYKTLKPKQTMLGFKNKSDLLKELH